MRHIFGFIILTSLLLGFSSCEKVKGKGEVVNQTRAITGFTGISLAIDATVYFSPDTGFYLEVRAQQNILDILQTELDANNNLIIKYKPSVIVGSHEPVEIFVAAPDMRSLSISGSGDILVDTPWETQYIETVTSGSGNINISQLDANEFRATISGSGNVQASSGTVNMQHLLISGSGNMDLLGLESDTTMATISGSGNITVWVNKLLDATISGSGNISYKGNPVVNTHISGSGSVIKI